MPYVPRRPTSRRTTHRKPAAAKPAVIRRRPAAKSAKLKAGPSRALVAAQSAPRSLVSRSKDRSSYVHRYPAGSGQYSTANALGGDFPNKKWVKFEYMDTLAIQTIPGAVGQLTYRLNSLYDPYSSGTGHQPRYFDTYLGANNTSAPYQNYRVHAASIKIEFQNVSTSSDQGIGFLHIRNSTANQLGGIIDIREVPNTYSVVLGQGSSEPAAVIQHFQKVDKILGIDDLNDDENTAADYFDNPANEVFMDIGFYPFITGGTADYWVTITLVYYAELFNLNFPTAS